MDKLKLDKLNFNKLKMRLRAEGRLKVHPRMKITALSYIVSGPGILKIIRLCFVLGAAVSFIIAPAHESYIAILLLECCIVLSFIIIYVLGLNHLLVFIMWPVFDILNCLLTSVFLIIIGLLVLWEEGTDEYIISGAACCFCAAGLCLLEMTCQGSQVWFTKWKKALREELSKVRKTEKQKAEKETAMQEETAVTPTTEMPTPSTSTPAATEPVPAAE